LVYVPPGGDGATAYFCRLASGIGTYIYAWTYSEGQDKCSVYAGVNCSPPVVFVEMGSY
jgi:hypothetical protein